MSVRVNHTFLDEATEAGNGTELKLNKYNYDNGLLMLIDVDGTSTTFVATFQAAGLNDSYSDVSAVQLSDMTATTTATSTSTLYQIDLTGLSKVRVELTSIDNGNVTVKGRLISG